MSMMFITLALLCVGIDGCAVLRRSLIPITIALICVGIDGCTVLRRSNIYIPTRFNWKEGVSSTPQLRRG